ncbi:hypothetical protein ABZZ79_22355 [Streptomyces sp. NPDC006458]|jgi:hypothetical protein|uniref:hypothetical protein n=1 Tax=Streptomyces TaxID=1883 RepID=UPI000690F69D|nr:MULTISPECIES: hypothetical protein [Streptomyces]MDX3204770.1 hypothetical protein [Streptomyces scabiei]
MSAMTLPSSAVNQRLSRFRRTQLEAALRDVQGEKRFGLYVLVNPQQDPAPRFAVVQALATRHEWTAAIRAVDFTGPTDPATRPQLARLLAALRQREIHGIVAASRVDISDDDQEYEAVLHQMRALHAGLALACRETVL